MQLTITTDYAIRIVLYLAMTNNVVSSNQLAETMKIPKTYISKITKKLMLAGIIRIHLGKEGGFCLIKEANQITLLEIIQIMEKTIQCNRCLENDGYCSRDATKTCPVHAFYTIFQKEMEERLASIHIHQLIENQEIIKAEI